MITKIEIDGFKSFLDFSMELRPLTVVLGANAAGKSNLLDALKVFKKVALDDLPDALQSERGHGSELFHRSATPRARFSVTLSNEIARLGVVCEKMRGNAFKLSKTYDGELLPDPLDFSNFLDFNVFIREREHLQYLNDVSKSVSHLDPIPQQLRQPGIEMGIEGMGIAEDGLYLPNALNALERVDNGEGQTRLDALQESLARLVPGVRSVEVRYDEEVAEYRLSILTRDGTKLPARLASDGTLRMLALLAALFDAEGGTLCFEEPENGLHPGQLRALIELLVERTAADVQPSLQVISTSHSPVVLAALIEAQRAAPEQVGIYFMDTARHIPEGATDPSQISTVSRVRRVVSDGESGRDVVTRGEVERYLHTADVEG
jgi:hypothetical protein